MNQTDRTCLARPPLPAAVSDALWILQRSHRDSRLTLTNIARQLRVSPQHLGVLISSHTGLSFRRHLSELRVRRAQQALLSSPVSIKEVALTVGYAHTSSFSREFKHSAGQSPTQWLETTRLLKSRTVQTDGPQS